MNSNNPGFAKRLTLRYMFVQIFYNMGYCTIMGFASVTLLACGFSNAQIGLTLTLANGAAILCQPLISAFADKTKTIPLRSITAFLALMLAVFSLLFLILPQNLLLTAFLYIMLVALVATQMSPINSLAMEHINAGTPMNFSFPRGLGSASYALLSLSMGYLVDYFGSWIIMAVTIVTGLLTAITLLRFPQPQAAKAAHHKESSASSLPQFIRENKRFFVVVCCIILIVFSHIVINTYTIQIIQHVGGSTSEMGIAVGIAAFLELPAMALFPLFLRKFKSAGTLLKISSVAFVAKSVMTLLAPNVYWIYGAQFLQFFTYGMFIPASVYYADRLITGTDRVKGQASMTMAVNLSAMIGNGLGGLMLDYGGGVPFMLAVGSGVSALGMVLLFLLAPRDIHT